MGYRVQLASAASWLESIQNDDSGWGRTKGLASSIVNTAEAVYVLGCANPRRHSESISRGLAFIERVTLPAVKKHPRTRYVLFALNAIVSHEEAFSQAFVDDAVAWLLTARNTDGGWGHEANDRQSRLFPTVAAVLALTELRRASELGTAETWLVSAQGAQGWGFTPGGPPHPVATSMAVVALRRFRPADDALFELSKSDLLTLDSWITAKEDLPGADWVHSAHAWGFAALTSLGFEPYVKPLAQGVRELNALQCPEGWREPDGHLTVRGQFWAVAAMENLRMAFDPAVHVYRIDAARIHSVALEPEFAVLRPHTAWTIVVPSRLYRLLAYLLLVVSASLFLGVTRIFPPPPKYIDFLCAVAVFLAAWHLVHKRPTYFPPWFRRSLGWLLAGLAAIDLVLGRSVESLWRLVNR